MTPFSIAGEDRGRLRYVLVHRVRELQSYTPRIEELQDRLRNPMLFDDVLESNLFPSVTIETIARLDRFMRIRSFDTNGDLLMNHGSEFHDLDMRDFVIDQWIIILQAFYEWVIEDESDEEDRKRLEIDAKFILHVFKDKKAEWTLEIEDLRRELDHMGDKMLALITDLSLNR